LQKTSAHNIMCTESKHLLLMVLYPVFKKGLICHLQFA